MRHKAKNVVLAIGVTAVVAQILVPFAAHLAPDHARGRVVGRVMSGLLLGILLARTVSGALSDAFGWRSVFWLAALVMLVQALVLARALPREPVKTRVSYVFLLRSVLHLLRDESLLRRRILAACLPLGGNRPLALRISKPGRLRIPPLRCSRLSSADWTV